MLLDDKKASMQEYITSVVIKINVSGEWVKNGEYRFIITISEYSISKRVLI